MLPPVPLPSTASKRDSGRRLLWRGHLWLGVALLLPLLWWTGTALVFSLWPIATIRGTTLARGGATPEVRLSGAHVPPAHLLPGARSLRVVPVRGRVLALVDRGPETEVWDLEAQRSLGPVIPLAWALDLAAADLAQASEPDAVYLLTRADGMHRILGSGPERAPLPTEYAGPLPAYAIHHPGRAGVHLYVDALDGQVRARRRALWRFYDLAFRLHSFEFTGDGLKRFVQLSVCLLWLALGVTGARMAWQRLRPARRNR